MAVQGLAGNRLPKPKPRGFSELRYLARLFDTVEINTSFYGPPRPTTTQQGLGLVAENPEFRFTAKLWKDFTHDRSATAKDERDMKDGLIPLVDANRLGALLLQFPWSFENSPENWSYLPALIKHFGELPQVLEVRHASWNEEPIRELLAELGVGVCNVDQPQFGLFNKAERSHDRAFGLHSLARAELRAVVFRRN